MRIELKEFQENTVDELAGAVRDAAQSSLRKPQTVALSAPTGAGKTVMITALIERILDGDDDHEPDPAATFLWLSDQPRINAQSRNRMMDVSSILDEFYLELVDYHFDQRVFDEGKVYFLNIQKLRTEAKLITPSDERDYSIWETINNTVEERPGRFFMIIDEAHRGVNGTSVNGQQTIVSRFLFGSEELAEPMPIVIGMSATPKRFQDIVAGKRALEPVDVPPEEVRESGLIKDQIVLKYNADDQASEFTLLGEAAKSWQRYVEEWAEYCNAEDEPLVEPKLIVQVEDAPSSKKTAPVTKTDLAECIATINEALGTPLPDYQYTHALTEGGIVEANAHSLRYVEAEKIAGDPTIKVVFFKTALSTGWDCPPAEVMMSFRAAKDETYIAQLIGRMVRTPLARQIADNEHLNSVDLFLPFYDEAKVDHIVARLTEDSEYVPPTTVTKQSFTLKQAKGSEDIFAALEKLPSHTIPRRSRPQQATRLVKLATRLAADKLDVDAPEKAVKLVVKELDRQLAEKRKDPRFKQGVDGKAIIEVGRKVFGVRAQETEESTLESVTAENRDIDRIFTMAGRRLGEGFHSDYWQHLVKDVATGTPKGLEELRTAKNTVVVLLADQEVIEAVEAVAEKQVADWLTKYRDAIEGLKEDARLRYKKIEGATVSPTEKTNHYPAAIEVPGKDEDVSLTDHIYVGDKGKFKSDLNQLERDVLAVELGRGDVVGWLRNYPRKSWSFCIPYQRKGGEWQGLYSDFLVARNDGGSVIIDIVDPHTTSQSDAAPKARGLAEYVARHGSHHGRVVMLDRIDGEIRALDVKDSKIRNQLLTINTSDQLIEIYKANGKPFS